MQSFTFHYMISVGHQETASLEITAPGWLEALLACETMVDRPSAWQPSDSNQSVAALLADARAMFAEKV